MFLNLFNYDLFPEFLLKHEQNKYTLPLHIIVLPLHINIKSYIKMSIIQ